MNQYNEVPKIISSKDLDYLGDIFNWNYDAYKKVINAKKQITDEEIMIFFEDVTNTFYNNLNEVLQILSQGGNYE